MHEVWYLYGQVTCMHTKSGTFYERETQHTKYGVQRGTLIGGKAQDNRAPREQISNWGLPRRSTAPGLGVCQWSPEGLYDKSVSLIYWWNIKISEEKNELIGLHWVDTQVWSCRRPWLYPASIFIEPLNDVLFCFCIVFWTVVAVQRPGRGLHRRRLFFSPTYPYRAWVSTIHDHSW